MYNVCGCATCTHIRFHGKARVSTTTTTTTNTYIRSQDEQLKRVVAGLPKVVWVGVALSQLTLSEDLGQLG